MTRKEWILKNLDGVVQKRALRAIEEQPKWEDRFFEHLPTSNLLHLFGWGKTKEGEEYWVSVHHDVPNPDQYLPKNYVDVDHVVEPNEMVKDEFLEWLDRKIELTREDNDLQREHWAFCQSYKKYNELKNAHQKSS